MDLKNLKLKANICEKLNLPVKLVLGRMKHLYIKIPWNALSTKPVQLEITGLELVLSPLDKQYWEHLVSMQNKFEVLEEDLIAHAMKMLQNLISEKRVAEHGEKDN